MVSSLALALSQIIPSLERFQTESNIQDITNAYLSFDAAIKEVITLDINSSKVVNYNIKTCQLDIFRGRLITIYLESGGKRFYNYSFYSGEITYTITGNYKSLGGLIYVYGSPKILVYSINRTTDITNIAYQTLDDKKVEKLYYNVFVTIEAMQQDVEVSFIILHLNTTMLSNGQKEYFPIINKPAKILITKIDQELKQIDLGTKNDELIIGAFTNSFSEKIIYPTAPANFNLTVNILHIYIDFSTL